MHIQVAYDFYFFLLYIYMQGSVVYLWGLYYYSFIEHLWDQNQVPCRKKSVS